MPRIIDLSISLDGEVSVKVEGLRAGVSYHTRREHYSVDMLSGRPIPHARHEAIPKAIWTLEEE